MVVVGYCFEIGVGVNVVGQGICFFQACVYVFVYCFKFCQGYQFFVDILLIGYDKKIIEQGLKLCDGFWIIGYLFKFIRMVDVFVWDLGIDDIVVVEEEGRVGYGFGFRGCC